MNVVTLKPKPGVKVRLPDGSGHLNEAGEVMLMSAYWRRRIKDGDVEIVTEPAAEAAATDAAAESETKTTKVKK